MNLTQPSYLNQIHFEQIQNLPWLDTLKKTALEQFNLSGMPSIRNDNWKYSNLQLLTKQNFHLQPALDSQSKAMDLPNLFGHKIVFIDGLLKPELSNFKDIKENVEVYSLTSALAAMDLKPYINQLAKSVDHGFANLNTLLLQNGLVLKINRDTRLSQPLHCIFYNTTPGFSNHLRNIIITEPNCEFEFIEHYYHAGELNYVTNSMTEVFVAENTKMKFYKLIEESQQAYHVSHTLFSQQAHSQTYAFSASQQGRFIRNDISIQLAAEHAACHLDGIYLTRGKQHVDQHTQIHHLKPHTTSQEYYKGILHDFSRAIFNGQVFVHYDAHHCDAKQSNKNLLLSDKAEVDTRPQLEIYNDDVRCAHGATVGQIDENALFYLCSRGIDVATARQMLMHAFAQDIIDAIPNLDIKNYLAGKLS
ncbi:MAG: Fe-S cluster assembly protein SufD [Pseudomonadota bacterium]